MKQVGILLLMTIVLSVNGQNKNIKTALLL